MSRARFNGRKKAFSRASRRAHKFAAHVDPRVNAWATVLYERGHRGHKPRTSRTVSKTSKVTRFVVFTFASFLQQQGLWELWETPASSAFSKSCGKARLHRGFP